MNERIKELAMTVQCNHHWSEANIEKFAELILHECANLIEGRDENGNAKDGQYLLTQFGIDASLRYT
jgi:hypothetical protein